MHLSLTPLAYTDNISNLHIWPQKKQGLTDTETQLSRAIDLASMPIFGHVLCTFGMTTAHNNSIYGHSPNAAMSKYGVI